MLSQKTSSAHLCTFSIGALARELEQTTDKALRERILAAMFHRISQQARRLAFSSVDGNTVSTIAADVLLEFRTGVELGYTDSQIVSYVRALIRRRFGRWRRLLRKEREMVDDYATVLQLGGPAEQSVDRDRLIGLCLFVVCEQTLSIILRHRLGHSFAEIARDAGILESTARARAHRGRAKLTRFWSTEARGCFAFLDELGPEADIVRMAVEQRMQLSEVVIKTGLPPETVRGHFANAMHRLALLEEISRRGATKGAPR